MLKQLIITENVLRIKTKYTLTKQSYELHRKKVEIKPIENIETLWQHHNFQENLERLWQNKIKIDINAWVNLIDLLWKIISICVIIVLSPIIFIINYMILMPWDIFSKCFIWLKKKEVTKINGGF